jgi:Cu(I)/Ag(I) efflux system membrane fusion protein
MEIANPQAKLKPGMYATVDLAPQDRREALLVPSEAVIRTGKRSVVVLAEGAQGSAQQFRTVDVEVGAEGDGMSEIRKGVSAGDRVVISGQFLIDSEASLKATSTRLGAPLADAAPGDVHRGEGKVERVGRTDVTISHGAIASLKWPAMTMDFGIPKSGLPASVKEGAHVRFAFRPTPQGEYEISSIEPDGAHGEHK